MPEQNATHSPSSWRSEDLLGEPERGLEPCREAVDVNAAGGEESMRVRTPAEGEFERLTAELELQRDTLLAIIEQVPLALLFLDNAPEGRIKLLSKQWRQMWSRPFVLGGLLAGHSEDHPAWFPDGRRLRDEDFGGTRALRGETVRQELVFERGDGGKRNVIDTASPLFDRKGNVIGSIVAVVDITEAKAREHEREKLLEEARRAVRARDEVLAVVSHDLRTPLGVVALAASQLANVDDDSDVATTRRLATRIHRAANAMEQIIGDLLDFARMEVGRLVVEPREEILTDVVGDTTDGFALLAAERGVELRSCLDSLAGIRVRCDRSQIARVISNLLGNALKFVPEGRGIEVGGYTTEHDAVLYVRDEGQGIRPEHIPYVFDRYWQSDEKDAKHGLGLGLAIVKGIIEEHGGRV